MSDSTAGVLFILALILALAYRPLGDYMYRVVGGRKHNRVERVIYRAVGVNPSGEQSWGVYARSVLAFSIVSILFLYAFLWLQNHLWLSLGFPAVFPAGARLVERSAGWRDTWHRHDGSARIGTGRRSSRSGCHVGSGDPTQWVWSVVCLPRVGSPARPSDTRASALCHALSASFLLEKVPAERRCPRMSAYTAV